jgi:hypothetical protein
MTTKTVLGLLSPSDYRGSAALQRDVIASLSEIEPGFNPAMYSLAVALAAFAILLSGCSKKTPAPATSKEATAAWTLALKVSPDHPRMVRPAAFRIHVADNAGKPVDSAQITGSLNMALMDMATTALKFAPKSNGDYEATVPGFDMSGPWELTVDATRGALHARKIFPVTVYD